ncbi:hypothetical protein HT031_003693 [Scenedesmus sp. PABB004]|nr:hypothetical protein HT031_003693 [Scenedesmus sp. PABB004]
MSAVDARPLAALAPLLALADVRSHLRHARSGPPSGGDGDDDAPLLRPARGAVPARRAPDAPCPPGVDAATSWRGRGATGATRAGTAASAAGARPGPDAEPSRADSPCEAASPHGGARRAPELAWLWSGGADGSPSAGGGPTSPAGGGGSLGCSPGSPGSPGAGPPRGRPRARQRPRSRTAGAGGDAGAPALAQRQPSPAEREALQQAVACAVDRRLRAYRQRCGAARQGLLDRELDAPPGSAEQPACAPPGGSAAAAGARGGVDAALLTMQALVALLAKRDAEPEPPDAADAQSQERAAAAAQSGGGAAPQAVSRTAAAGAKLAAARTASQLLEAAMEHLAAAAHEFDAAQPRGERGVGGADGSGAAAAAESRAAMPPPPQPLAPGTAAAAAAESAGPAAAGGGAACAPPRPDAAPAGPGRPPPGMRVPAPRLAAPSAAELASVPMPSLPALLDLSAEPARVLMARLERVWGALGTAPVQQMAMVLSYTSRAAVGRFDAALAAWEGAAAAVLQREGLLAQLLELRGALAAARQQPGALAAWDGQRVVEACWAFLAATQQVAVAAGRLEAATGCALTVRGAPYPPAGSVVDAAQLQPLVDEAWAALGAARIDAASGPDTQ